MMDKQTLEWMERRKNLCTRCYKRGWCRAGAMHNFNTTKCHYFEMSAPGRITGYTFEDYSDAAEFEARVAVKMAEPWILSGGKPNCPRNGCIVPMQRQKLKPRDAERICAWCVIKYARLAVEREMIAEGKGPSGRMGKDNGI